ncbi:MAG: DUF2157 domain-containing protein [Candidatus Riflebacteria bacterium]|nr:DUF2157 domain-containing protein [Candidatus Riflebacteria bacterium]
MLITKADLLKAEQAGILQLSQAEMLWKFLSGLCGSKTDPPAENESIRFDFVNFLYFFGALLVMSAMGWFMTLGWEIFGGIGISIIATGYAAIFVIAGKYMWYEKNTRTPGGILFALAVWMTPLIVYGVQKALGMWNGAGPSSFQSYHVLINANWLIMEFATLIVAGFVLKKIRFPFIMFTVAFTLWYMSMDIAPFLMQNDLSWEAKQNISVAFGFLMLIVGAIIDRRTKEDFAFWVYLFGTLAFWFGLTTMSSNGEFGKFLYFLINLAMMFFALLLDRRVLMVFGSMGTMGYIGYLSHRIFGDSILFPFVLSGIGICFIVSGVLFSRNKEKLELTLLNLLPETVRKALPRFRSEGTEMNENSR